MTDAELTKNIANAIDRALDHIVPRVVREQLFMAGVTPRGDRAATGETQTVTKRSVLETAIQTVADRGVPYGGVPYGGVEDNFNRIAELWSVHTVNRYGTDLKFDAADVAMMMALMKIARLQANPGHMDSWVDVAGYAACGGEIGSRLDSDVG